jgi:thioredoxin 1
MIEVIKFGAEWCGPCKMVAPTITKLQEKYNVEGSDIQVTSIDVDKNPEFSQEHRVQSIPTFIFKKDGVQVDKKVGVLRENQIEEIINTLKSN